MPATSKVIWHGRSHFAIVRRGLRAGMKRGADRAAKMVRAKVSIPYPPASSPGNPPHRRTGRLMRSIRSRIGDRGNNVVVEVVATAPYASYLQEGTRRMLARPFLPGEVGAIGLLIGRPSGKSVIGQILRGLFGR